MEYINKILQGDCIEVMKGIEDKSIDLIITDPPYGINYQSNMRVISKKFDILENDNNDFRYMIYNKINRILKDNCVTLIFCSYKNYANDYQELKKYFDIKNVIIWDKGGGGIGDLQHSLSTDYEMIIACHKGARKINGKRIGSVWHVNKVDPIKMQHPTQKPVGIFRMLIRIYSNKNDIVLDPFIGSGTTAVACKELGRKYIGIEISEEYCEVARRRILAVPELLF